MKHPQKPQGKRIENLIVSFTSFPARIDKVWMVVECLKRQTILPEKIILWLSKEQFPTNDAIPQTLWDRVDDLFEIRMVEEDIKSYKKCYYAFLEYPLKTIIVVDDDIFYHHDTIRYLFECSQQYPQSVIANTSGQLVYENGALKPYYEWTRWNKPYESLNIMPKGVGGVLYPPHSLFYLATCKELFLRLAPMADDLWLNAMARMNGTQVVQSSCQILFLGIFSKSPSLSDRNVDGGENDVQLSGIRRYFIENYKNDIYAERNERRNAQFE